MRHSGDCLATTTISFSLCIKPRSAFPLCILQCSSASHWVVSDSLWPQGLKPTVPRTMGFSGQEYWSGLPQEWIFLTQGWNPGLLYFRQIICPLSYQGSLYIFTCFLLKYQLKIVAEEPSEAFCGIVSISGSTSPSLGFPQLIPFNILAIRPQD